MLITKILGFQFSDIKGVMGLVNETNFKGMDQCGGWVFVFFFVLVIIRFRYLKIKNSGSYLLFHTPPYFLSRSLLLYNLSSIHHRIAIAITNQMHSFTKNKETMMLS
jgi:hypothetical protein